MRVCLICTVLNEGESIRRLLEGVCCQTRQPDEFVIVDGGSRDNTVAIIEEYAGRLPMHVVVEPGANISRGRNVAIAAATAEIIASVDAGVRLEPDWLEKLVAPIEASGGHQPTSAGFFLPDTRGTFDIAMGATVLPALRDIDPEEFLPSSRSVAFTKTAWVAAGGYPEWLDYCEDLIFDLRVREATGRFAFTPEAVVHFRPRGTLQSFFKQYYRYARGDGKADLWRLRHAIRYATYLVALPALIGLVLFHRAAWLFALLAGVAAYCRAPYRRLAHVFGGLSRAEQLHAVALVPVIRFVGDLAKMVGYPVGWMWRLRNWTRPEIHWRRRT
jgi:glycosyltransferase involved in cell wall biosynthesis